MTTSTNGAASATVQALTAEVRVLMVGKPTGHTQRLPPAGLETLRGHRAVRPRPRNQAHRLRRAHPRNRRPVSRRQPRRLRHHPPNGHTEGPHEYRHWTYHRRTPPGQHQRIDDTRLHWRGWSDYESAVCRARGHRDDLPNDNADITVISDINPADKPHVQIAGFLQDKLHTSEQPDRGTWTRTWLTPAGIGPKIPTIIPPEVPLPTESKWTRHMLAGQALPSTDGAPGPFRFLVDRIVPPEVTTAYANKWLKAEHSHLARVGELCDMDALRETWTAKAQRQAAELTQRQELYDRAKALPLIVLAGLK